MRKLIYKEDSQMYYFTPVIFETDCVLSVSQMSDISCQPPQAGRISTSFNTFAKLMRDLGYKVEEIKRLPKNEMPEDLNLEVVIGATGNY